MIRQILDHGQPEYIVSVHWLKTALAAREECKYLNAEHNDLLFAAVNRFIQSPLKRRQVKRVVYQSLGFVEKA